MTQSFRTHVPYRHNHLVDVGEERLPLSWSFRTSKPVRPARLVFQGQPQPRTQALVDWIRRCDPRRQGGGEDRHRPPYSPFVYRGDVAAHPEGEADVEVRLWEEPSGRPLEAQLPRDWFEQIVPYKGMPFRLVTWMVEDETGATIEKLTRHRIELLGTDIAQEVEQ